MEKKLAILGSTGSIGRQALDVVDRNPGKFRVNVITAESNTRLLVRQALRYRPEAVVIARKSLYEEVKNGLHGSGIAIFSGREALEDVIGEFPADIILNALVGFAGLFPTLTAMEKGIDMCLANKESLVVAGELITELSKKNGGALIPVDSEHSAIFQCLQGEQPGAVKNLYLTASGGPFRGKDAEYLAKVTREDALAHPTWQMGQKITVDSATLMNKGLEVIEARWLFDVAPEQIRVVIHPESIVHSMVEFIDGSFKAQLSVPDMRMAIHYALNFPVREPLPVKSLDFGNTLGLTFEPPDMKNFRNLALACEALEKGGNTPCILNAANEVAVKAFLDGKTGFLDIGRIVEECLTVTPFILEPDLGDLISTDKSVRLKAEELVIKYTH